MSIFLNIVFVILLVAGIPYSIFTLIKNAVDAQKAGNLLKTWVLGWIAGVITLFVTLMAFAYYVAF